MPRISELETSETLMREVAQAAREEAGAEAYREALEGLTAAVCEAVGVKTSLETSDEIAHILQRVDGDAEAALREPHVFGWFHQHFGEPERAASHRAHSREEAKHASQTATTQLYTPRWIADLLADRAVAAAGDRLPTVLDPAVGGGQFLVAAYEALARRHPDASPAEIAGRLRGIDVDARAVEVARRTLALHIARQVGGRREPVEAVIAEQIRVGDGLFDALSTADVVLTNPPYMGSRSMPADLKARVRKRYEPFHGDLYAAFIRRCHELAADGVGILAQQTIWYLKRFRKAREWLLEAGDLEAFVHLGPHAFASLSGEKANVVAFVQRSGGRTEGAETQFVDLRDLNGPGAMRDSLAAAPDDRRVGRSKGTVGEGAWTCLDIDELATIPGRPVSYWVPGPLRDWFEGTRRLGDLAEVPGCQNKTGANREYVRDWREVALEAVEWRPMRVDPAEAPSRSEPRRDSRWYFYSKGGRYAPWWGNWQNVVDWSDEARAFYADNSTSNLLPEQFRGREGICYTDFGGRSFNARWMPAGCLFDMAGPAIFPALGESTSRRRLFALLALLNSGPVEILLNGLNPSIHYQITDLRRLPVPEWDADTGRRLAELAIAQIRDLRRVAAGLEASPVGGHREGPTEAPEPGEVEAIADRVAERERTVDEIAWAIYGAEPSADPERSRHHYLP